MTPGWRSSDWIAQKVGVATIVKDLMTKSNHE